MCVPCGTGGKCHKCFRWFIPEHPKLRRIHVDGHDWCAECLGMALKGEYHPPPVHPLNDDPWKYKD
jgi:hypothetical protein